MIEAGLCWFSSHATEIIALCALFLTAYQVTAIRKHNKLSVQPHLTTLTIHRDVDMENKKVLIELRNNGLGPAVIKSFSVEYGNKTYQFKDASEANSTYQDILGFKPANLFSTVLTKGHAMAQDEKEVIMEFDYPVASVNCFDGINHMLQNSSLRIEYESIYGEQFVYHSEDSHL